MELCVHDYLISTLNIWKIETKYKHKKENMNKIKIKFEYNLTK